MHIQPGGQRPVTGHFAHPGLCLAICPSAVELPSRGRSGGAASPVTQGLSRPAGLFIPLGPPRAPTPITGSGILTESSKTLPFSYSERTKPRHVTPLLSVFQCFPFSSQKPQASQWATKPDPIWPFPLRSSSPATLASSLFLKDAKHTPARAFVLAVLAPIFA